LALFSFYQFVNVYHTAITALLVPPLPFLSPDRHTANPMIATGYIRIVMRCAFMCFLWCLCIKRNACSVGGVSKSLDI